MLSPAWKVLDAGGSAEDVHGRAASTLALRLSSAAAADAAGARHHRVGHRGCRIDQFRDERSAAGT